MMLFYLIVWELLALLDIISTYNYLSTTKKLFPNLDYKKGERNPLPRFFIQRLGLLQGLVVFHCIFPFCKSAFMVRIFIGNR